MPPKQRKPTKAVAAEEAVKPSKRESTKSQVSRKKTSKKAVEPEFIDIFIRMNESPSKDYCFNVSTDKPVSSLYDIFETIPVRLTPSFFFDSRPDAFAISTQPGYMTAEGGILFENEAHFSEWLKIVPLDALIGDVLTEGQLIVPIWHHNLLREHAVRALLLVWLYLDLPEFISPTPGTAPSYFLLWVLDQFIDVPRTKGRSFLDDYRFQILFFVFHIAKVALIYLILWNGFWDPSARLDRSRPMPTAEQLASIGWTGARRCSWMDWSERYTKVRTDQAGGVLEAHRQGLLTKPIGLHLREDEGWNVLKDHKLSEVKVQKDLLDDEGKFVVSEPYFLELAKPLTNFLKDTEATDDEKLQMLKEFRECGGFAGTDFLREFFMDQVGLDEREYGGSHIEQMGRNSR